MNMQYLSITQQYDRYEAGYQYLSDNFSPSAPFMFPELIDHLLRCLDCSLSEAQFKRDAKTMFNI